MSRESSSEEFSDADPVMDLDGNIIEGEQESSAEGPESQQDIAEEDEESDSSDMAGFIVADDVDDDYDEEEEEEESSERLIMELKQTIRKPASKHIIRALIRIAKQ